MNPNLRQVTVTVRYKVDNAWRTYGSLPTSRRTPKRTDAMTPATRPGLAATAGYSLIELLVSMGILTVVMGATLAGMAEHR